MISKNRRKIINSISLLLIITIMITCFSSSAFAIDDDSGDKPNILERILAGILKSVSSLIHKMLDGEGIGLDQMVYMTEDGPFTGLTLFKPGEAQDLLALFYNVFNYMALAMLVPIFYWNGISISKAGDNPQAKSMMKDRLNKTILTVAFLYTMPQLLTILVTVSNGFVQLFAGLGGEVGGLVNDYIQLPEDYNLVDAATSAVLVGINIWMISFYVIRDLTICFLFILFGIIAIWHPFSDGIVKSWGQNMMGNVFAQPIQAFVLTIVLAIGKVLPTNSFATGIYVLVAFGSIVPMTGIIKGFLKLETGIGAGSSRAGLGGAMGAIALAKQMYSNLKGSAGSVIDGVREAEAIKRGNEVASSEINKNIPTSNRTSTEEELSRPLINPKVANVSMGDVSTEQGKQVAQEALARQNRVANRKMYSAVASGVGRAALGTAGSVVGGMVGTTIGAGAGGGWDSNAARGLGMAGASIGLDVGSDLGIVSGHASGFAYDRYQGTQANKAMEADIQDLQVREVMSSMGDNGEKIDETAARDIINPDSQNYNAELAQTTRVAAENKYLGIEGEKLDGTKWQEQERQALMQKKRRQNTGSYAFNDYLARRDYANLTPSRKSAEELRQITDASLYQDKERTIAYRPTEDGSYEILSVGTGNPNLTEPTINPISFQSNSNEIPDDAMFKIDSDAREGAHNYMAKAYPDIVDTSSQEYMKPFNEKVSEYKRDMKHSYQDNLKSVRENLGISSMSVQTNETRLEELVAEDNHKVEMQKLAEQQRKLEKMREENDKKVYQQYSRLSAQAQGTGYVNIENLF
ncbi:hypothetical protein NE686_17200 [Tissierella carlieri]|uniref:Uncharacterized protein n=1 Tax=Tissierella carlieri TaxID=689904 RepID=A0ABT1SG04_9FIRM|nr:hypothetical protein [Tissierella carlieri]MCQ4924842.1 hypothetical protein [Tissierella carlieri]